MFLAELTSANCRLSTRIDGMLRHLGHGLLERRILDVKVATWTKAREEGAFDSIRVRSDESFVLILEERDSRRC